MTKIKAVIDHSNGLGNTNYSTALSNGNGNANDTLTISGKGSNPILVKMEHIKLYLHTTMLLLIW